FLYIARLFLTKGGFMKYRHYLLAAIISGVNGVNAAPTSSQISTQFYLGLSGGAERMTGKRSESFTEDDPLSNRIKIIDQTQSMSTNNAMTSLLAGFSWKLSNLPVLLGPEIYFGRGNTSSKTEVPHQGPAGEH